MKKLIIIVIILLINGSLFSQKNIYLFELGISDIDPFDSQVVRMDYSRSLKKQKWRFGLILQYLNVNYYRNDDSPQTKVFDYTRGYGRDFLYKEYLKNHEKDAGSIILRSVRQYDRETFFGPYISRNWQKNNFSFACALGIGPIHCSYLRFSSAVSNTKLSLDTTKEGYFVTYGFSNGYSIAGYLDVRAAYIFDNHLVIGTKLSFDYDIIYLGGFPLKSTFFIGINF